jgi:hypothetical protein
LIESLRSDLTATDAVAKSADSLSKSNKGEIDELRGLIGKLQADLEAVRSELANKVDCDDFDALR